MFVEPSVRKRCKSVSDAKGKKIFLKIGVTVALLVLAIGLMAYAIARSAGTYVKVDQLVGRAERWRGRTVWLGGRLVAGSLFSQKKQATQTHRFVLQWNGKRITVKYRGALPSSFVAGRQITARGALHASGVFVATQITTRCPSKYKSKGTP
jgi:cytochrome c-type biogenesis protein CcmE